MGGLGGYAEICERWSIVDVWDANQMLDLKEDAEAIALDR